MRAFFSRFVEILSLPIGDVWFLLVQWLRRPRWAKKGTLRPVIVTDTGVAVPSVSRVPFRSDRADGKRAALKYCRERFGEPDMTWSRARKLMRRLEREEREQGVPGE